MESDEHMGYTCKGSLEFRWRSLGWCTRLFHFATLCAKCLDTLNRRMFALRWAGRLFELIQYGMEVLGTVSLVRRSPPCSRQVTSSQRSGEK